MDVTLPDGRVITNVREGMTQTELLRRPTTSQGPELWPEPFPSSPVVAMEPALGDAAMSTDMG